MRHAFTFRRRSRQTGVALVVALLVLGVIAAVATVLAHEFALTLRRSQNVLRSEQAWEYLLGAEQLAALMIAGDEEPARDHFGELWAQGMQAYPIDGGWLRGGLEDLQGRFNINQLRRSAPAEGLPPPVPATEAERRFMRLILAVGGEEADENIARATTEALIDWLDADIEETGFGGAEDNAYGDLEPPYRPANRPAQSTSELRLLADMSPELFNALESHVSAWPPGGSAINVNTATRPVLASLAPEGLQPLDVQSVDQLAEAQVNEGFNDVAGFAEAPAWGGELPVDGLDIKTEWFLLRTEVEFEGLFWQMQSVLSREDGRVRVMARSIGEL